MLTRKSGFGSSGQLSCLSDLHVICVAAALLQPFVVNGSYSVDFNIPCTVAFAPAAARRPIDPARKY